MSGCGTHSVEIANTQHTYLREDNSKDLQCALLEVHLAAGNHVNEGSPFFQTTIQCQFRKLCKKDNEGQSELSTAFTRTPQLSVDGTRLPLEKILFGKTGAIIYTAYPP